MKQENKLFNNRDELLKYLDSGEGDMTIDLRFEFTDNDVIWFGKHKGKKLIDIPISWFTWLWKEGYSQKMRAPEKEGKLARYISKAINGK